MISRFVQNAFVLWVEMERTDMYFAGISAMARNLQAVKSDQANQVRHQ